MRGTEMKESHRLAADGLASFPRDRGRGGAAAIGCSYIAVLGVLSVVAVAVARAYGVVFFVFPAFVVSAVVGIAIFLIRIDRWLGAVVMAGVFLIIGSLFIYADLHYALNPYLTQGLTRDIGGAIYHHPFTHAGLVFGVFHVLLAAGTIVLH